MVGRAEGLIDPQVQTAERLDKATEQMITLALASVAAATTVVLFIGQEPDIRAGFPEALLFAVGLVLNLIAVWWFIDGYVGARRLNELYIAPSIDWLDQKQADATWDLEDHLGSLVSSYAQYASTNGAVMKRNVGVRRVGLYLFLGAFLAFVGATALMVGRAIGA